MEIWVRPSGPVAAPSSQRGGSESSRDSEQDGELVSLSASEVSPPGSSGSFVLVLLFSVAVLVYSVLSTAGSSGFISAYTETQEVQLYLSKFISSVYFISSFNDVPVRHLSSRSGNIL